jgi:hypothetical protein
MFDLRKYAIEEKRGKNIQRELDESHGIKRESER